MWQMVGFFLGWLGGLGKGRALGVGEVKFSGMVLPTAKLVSYYIDLKRVIMRKLVVGIADGIMKVDGKVIYEAKDLQASACSSTRSAQLEQAPRRLTFFARLREADEGGTNPSLRLSRLRGDRKNEGETSMRRVVVTGHGHRLFHRQQCTGSGRVAARSHVRHHRGRRLSQDWVSAARCMAA